MSQLGAPIKIVTYEPLELPIPRRETKPEPERKLLPVRVPATPERERVTVGWR